MTTGKVLLVGGPQAGDRGYLEIRDHMDVEQSERPDHESLPNYHYDQGRDVWICRYTRRHGMWGEFVIYAPANWSNIEVLSELCRGYLV